MIKYKIVLVPFPFDDFSSTKLRPAICLTNKIGSYNHVVIAFITSQTIKNQDKTDVLIKKDNIGFDQTGLSIDSAIKLHRMITVPVSLIKRELGKLPAHYHREMKEKLISLFGI